MSFPEMAQAVADLRTGVDALSSALARRKAACQLTHKTRKRLAAVGPPGKKPQYFNWGNVSANFFVIRHPVKDKEGNILYWVEY